MTKRFWVAVLLVFAASPFLLVAAAWFLFHGGPSYVPADVAPAQVCEVHGGTDSVFSTSDFTDPAFTGNVYCQDGSTFGYTDGRQDR